jgi:hypothetical protein
MTRKFLILQVRLDGFSEFGIHVIVEQRKDAWSPFLRDKLVFKAADQLRLSQDVPLHRALEITLCSSRGELCGLIKGI